MFLLPCGVEDPRRLKSEFTNDGSTMCSRFKSAPNAKRTISAGSQQRAVDVLKSTKAGRFAEMVMAKNNITYSSGFDSVCRI